MRRRAPGIPSLCVAPLLLLGLARPALAVDGVRAINQACATATGCFALDSTGFPVTIEAPGSYRLTSNLTLPDGNTTAIRVLEPDASIDLNGFHIACPGCAPGIGNGILAVAGASRLRVRNGTIRGVGAAGIDAADFAVIEDVTVLDAGSYGIRALDSARVTACTVESSGNHGIALGSFASVHGNTSKANTGHGITTPLATVSGNVSSANSANGIYCLDRCTIDGNVATGNGDSGIWATESSVHGNTVRSNELGITAFNSVVVANTIVDNADVGLQAGPSTAYASNVLVDNNGGGAQVSLGNPIGLNVCMNDTTCP